MIKMPQIPVKGNTTTSSNGRPGYYKNQGHPPKYNTKQLPAAKKGS